MIGRSCVVMAAGLVLPLTAGRVEAQPVALVHAELHEFVAAPTVTAVRSGAWSDGGTWGGAVPREGARVAIPAGVVVTVDREVTTAYDWVRVDGTLRFQPDVSTLLLVETVVAMGRLEMGTVNAPIQPHVTARLMIRSAGTAIDHARDPLELSRGVVAMAPVWIHGSAKTEILALAALPEAGATTLQLETDPVGWRVGDEILVAPTVYGQDEVVRVTALSGRTVSIAPALQYPRTNVPRAGLKVHVGNLTRNVVIGTDATQAGTPALQGHVMLMGGSHRVAHAAFTDLGRTGVKPATDPILRPDGTRDPQLMPICRVTEENVRGRYAVHFHNPGPDSPLSVVEGAVVRVKRNSALKVGIINHSGYVAVRRSIVHQVDGSGLFTEEGNERGEFRDNFVVHSNGGGARLSQPRFPCLKNNYPVIKNARRHDLGGMGNGIWFQGKDVSAIRNILVGHNSAGIEMSGGSLSRFVDNTFEVRFPARLLRDGDAWLVASGQYPKDGMIDLGGPILLWADNQIYAIGGTRNASSRAGIRLQSGLHNSSYRPKDRLLRNLIWNVPKCVTASYSSRVAVEDLTCIGGAIHPMLANPRVVGLGVGVTAHSQGGRDWDFVRVRIYGFTPGKELSPGANPTFQDVTINGDPYIPKVEVCGDRIDNDGDGLIDEQCSVNTAPRGPVVGMTASKTPGTTMTVAEPKATTATPRTTAAAPKTALAGAKTKRVASKAKLAPPQKLRVVPNQGR